MPFYLDTQSQHGLPAIFHWLHCPISSREVILYIQIQAATPQPALKSSVGTLANQDKQQIL